MALTEAVESMGNHSGAFVLNASGVAIGLLTAESAAHAMSNGDVSVGAALIDDFDTASPTTTFNDCYNAAGRGLTLAVVGDRGQLIGSVDPREIMEEMGRVERLIDGFEREVFM